MKRIAESLLFLFWAVGLGFVIGAIFGISVTTGMQQFHIEEWGTFWSAVEAVGTWLAFGSVVWIAWWQMTKADRADKEAKARIIRPHTNALREWCAAGMSRFCFENLELHDLADRIEARGLLNATDRQMMGTIRRLMPYADGALHHAMVDCVERLEDLHAFMTAAALEARADKKNGPAYLVFDNVCQSCFSAMEDLGALLEPFVPDLRQVEAARRQRDAIWQKDWSE